MDDRSSPRNSHGPCNALCWFGMRGTACHRPLLANHQIEGAFKIKHVVWIMQENRSFDNLFQGYPGSDTSSSGKDSHGHTISLAPISFTAGYDIDHSSIAHFAACNGTGAIPVRSAGCPGSTARSSAAINLVRRTRNMVTFPTRRRDSISIWRTSTSWPIACLHRPRS